MDKPAQFRNRGSNPYFFDIPQYVFFKDSSIATPEKLQLDSSDTLKLHLFEDFYELLAGDLREKLNRYFNTSFSYDELLGSEFKMKSQLTLSPIIIYIGKIDYERFCAVLNQYPKLTHLHDFLLFVLAKLEKLSIERINPMVVAWEKGNLNTLSEDLVSLKRLLMDNSRKSKSKWQTNLQSLEFKGKSLESISISHPLLLKSVVEHLEKTFLVESEPAKRAPERLIQRIYKYNTATKFRDDLIFNFHRLFQEEEVFRNEGRRVSNKEIRVISCFLSIAKVPIMGRKKEWSLTTDMENIIAIIRTSITRYK